MEKIYTSIIEALIFASDEPLATSEVIRAIKGIDGEDINLSFEDIDNAVNEINEKYRGDDFPFQVKRISGGLLFATKPEYAKYIGYLSSEKSKRRLSQAALETLAIIAYKQPITKPELESIRGVNSDYIINTLMEKNLITIKGRAESIGRPLLYGTTNEFLFYFGLNDLSDLPKPREIEDIMKDEDFLEQKRKIMMNELEEKMENEIKEELAGEENDQTE